MNISAPFEANAKTPEVMEPGMYAFDHPAIFSQAAAVFGSALRNDRLNATFAHYLAMQLGVVAAISKDRLRLLQRPTGLATQPQNGIDQRRQLRNIMAIRAGQNGRDWDDVSIGCYMVLGTWSRTIRGFSPVFGPPQLLELMMNRRSPARSRSGLPL